MVYRTDDLQPEEDKSNIVYNASELRRINSKAVSTQEDAEGID